MEGLPKGAVVADVRWEGGNKHFRHASFCHHRRPHATLKSALVSPQVGCGNGKYFGVREDVAVIGSDRSPGADGVKLSSVVLTEPPTHFCPHLAQASRQLRPEGCSPSASPAATLGHLPCRGRTCLWPTPSPYPIVRAAATQHSALRCVGSG